MAINGKNKKEKNGTYVPTRFAGTNDFTPFFLAKNLQRFILLRIKKMMQRFQKKNGDIYVGH